jgi:hypothetical protein
MAGFYQTQRKVLRQIGAKGVRDLRKELIKLDKVASGKTIDSVRNLTQFSERRSSVEIRANESIIYIDRGRRPNGPFPPVDVIEQWVETKGIVFSDPRTGRPLPLAVTAFLIGRSIAEKGIQPTNVIEKTFNRLSFQKFVRRRVTDASLEDIIERQYTLGKRV